MSEEVIEMLIPLIAVILGSMMFLIPIAGLTARFALKPVLEAVARMRELQGRSPDQAREVAILEQRVSLLEQQLQGIETNVHRIQDSVNFDRQLRPGAEG